ncbi:MAG: hypothetical protein DRP83_04745 [Planctomycetota bacterium]|nr:MAG: hypothetical protein DRP83_04745 [Planctomycetota bacterium]
MLFHRASSTGVVRVFVMVFIASAGMLFTSCEKEQAPPEVVRPVKLMTLDSPGIFKALSFPARIKAFQEANLSFLQPGRIDKILVKRGQPVKPNQPLAKLDPKDYQNRYNASMARVRERSLNLTRMREAFDKQVATEVEVEQARRDYEVAKADAAITRKALNDTILRAPFAGEIGWQFKETYQDVAAKEKIFRLQDVTKLKVIVDVPESVLFLVRGNGTKAEQDAKTSTFATFDDLPGKRFAVTYFEAEQTADPTTKTYAVTFIMPAPKPGLILPGMSATLQGKIPLDAKDDSEAFYLPVNAVFSGPGSERFVWVQDPKTARVARRDVKVGSMADGNIQVLTGLTVGDIVATSGVHHLRDGMKIKPVVFQARRAAE